jgi:hypothetical protein
MLFEVQEVGSSNLLTCCVEGDKISESDFYSDMWDCKVNCLVGYKPDYLSSDSLLMVLKAPK